MRDQYLICLFVYNGFFYPFMKIFLVYIQNLYIDFMEVKLVFIV